jgi:hypothetical protein
VADVLASEGTSEQLPRGAATAINEATPSETEMQSGQVDVGPLPEPAEAADYEPEFEPATDDEDFITGPSLRPDEDVTVGTILQPRVPSHVRKQLPALQEAASAPGASAELQALVAYLLRMS